MPEFVGFPKIARFSRDIIVTEKINGTNAQIAIFDMNEFPDPEHPIYEENGLALFAGSRTRWIQPGNDNHGFASWVEKNKKELLSLGPGRHFGEWWGQGIQNNYGLKEKRFSLFNVQRWCLFGQEPRQISSSGKMQEVLPQCCGLVPVLYEGPFAMDAIEACLEYLRSKGSAASPGFMDPEGIVIYHTAGNVAFKKTLKNDDIPKGMQKS